MFQSRRATGLRHAPTGRQNYGRARKLLRLSHRTRCSNYGADVICTSVATAQDNAGLRFWIVTTRRPLNLTDSMNIPVPLFRTVFCCKRFPLLPSLTATQIFKSHGLGNVVVCNVSFAPLKTVPPSSARP